jgi:hypothetical protein
MKNESTTHKAEGLGETETRKAEIRNGANPQAADEQAFLEQLREYLRTAKNNPSPTVTRIAREWERVINYRILVSLQMRERRAAARARREAARVQVSATSRLG